MLADLGYECCTWENDADTAILDPRYLKLLTSFWHRQYECHALALPEARTEHERLVAAALAALPQTPAEDSAEQAGSQLRDGMAQLEPHQLAGAAFLRRLYLQEQDAIIADDQALGVAATVLQFLRVCAVPACVVSSGLAVLRAAT
jgi:SNF2 family DNA or RNA helicase